MLAFGLGLGAGVLTAVLMRLVDSLPLAVALAPYTSATLLAGIIGSSLAIYATWCWVLRTGRPQRDLALSVAGLYLGVVAGVPAPPPGPLFAGLLLVLLTAAVAYLVQWTLLTPAGCGTNVTVLTLIVVAGLTLAVWLRIVLVPPPLVTAGFFVGPCVVVGSRSTTRAAVGLGALLLVVLLAVGLAIPLLIR